MTQDLLDSKLLLNKNKIEVDGILGMDTKFRKSSQNIKYYIVKEVYTHDIDPDEKIINKVGMGYVLRDDGYNVGCLITSKFYGMRKDNPRTILVNTYNSLLNLFSSIEQDSFVIQSPKINSGLFATPWDLTSKIIERAISKFEDKDITWITREI